MFDYHIHPNYSIDAEGSIEEHCEMALARGLREIAFTTHLDTDPVADDCYVNVRGKTVSTRSSEWLENYEQSVRAADDTYKDKGLRVRLGVEVDYIDDIEPSLPDCFHNTDFDIILGSMHLIDHIAISAKGRAEQAFVNYSVEELGHKYYSKLIDAVESGLFDIIAHIDLYRRYGQEFYGEGIRSIWKPYIKDLARAMKKHHVGFEINTSTLRKGLEQPMPEPEIVRHLRDEGISIVTVGSDAHTPKDVGAGIETSYTLLKNVGYTEVTLFERRRRRQVRIQ